MPTPKTFNFPHDPLTPLDPQHEPTPTSARLLRRELYANARSVPTTLGGGDHGHLGLVMGEEAYAELSNGGVTYDFPDKPNVPRYAEGVAQRERQKAEYIQALEEYHDARDVQNQLKAQLMQAIPDTYREALADMDLGYSEVTAMDLLDHIVDTYGTITTIDLEANLQQIATPWDPDTPIASVFVTGNRCRQFAKEGGDPISDHTYMRILAKTFRNSGVLDDAIKEWDATPTNTRTVIRCVKHFTKADKYRRDTRHYLKTTMEANQATAARTPTTEDKPKRQQ